MANDYERAIADVIALLKTFIHDPSPDYLIVLVDELRLKEQKRVMDRRKPKVRRCPKRSPGGVTPEGTLPRKGKQCGLYAGHSGQCTVLRPSDAPWFSEERKS